jgi:hypothetical protein
MIVQDPTPQLATPGALTPLKVLVIEDNPLDARLIQIMVAEAGAGLFQIDCVDRVSLGLCSIFPFLTAMD